MRIEPNRNVYVGHRYVPKIFGEWDKKFEYEGLSIVTHQGDSYTSKKRVPVGIDIHNEEFWVVTGNYNAQIEYYRDDVRKLRKSVEKNTKDLNSRMVNVLYPPEGYTPFKGDGTCDDTDNLCKLIQDFDVFIPAGEYRLNGTIKIPSHRTIKGTHETILNMTESTFIADNSIHIFIEKMRFVEDDITSKEPVITVKNSSSRTVFRDLYFDTVYNPIRIDYSWIVEFTDIRVHNAVIGLFLAPQANAISVKDSVINNCTLYAIDYRNSEGLTLSNVAMHNNKIALNLGVYSVGITVTGCYFEDNFMNNIVMKGAVKDDKIVRGINITGNHFRQPLGIKDGTLEEKNLSSDIYVRNSNGVIISANNFFGLTRINYIILHNYPNEPHNDNLTVSNNSFESDNVNTAISYSSVYENQSKFITGYYLQPYYTIGTDSKPNTLVMRDDSGSVKSSPVMKSSSSLTYLDYVMTDYIVNAVLTSNFSFNDYFFDDEYPNPFVVRAVFTIFSGVSTMYHAEYVITYVSSEMFRIKEVETHPYLEVSIVNGKIKGRYTREEVERKIVMTLTPM